MHYEKLDRFYASLQELEISFSHIRKKLLNASEVPAFILGRLDTYQEICSKQRRYGELVRFHLLCENYEEVARYITLINALSTMIMEDVHEFILMLQDMNIDIEPLSTVK